MAIYETVIIIRPNVEKEALDNLMDSIFNSLKELNIEPIKVMNIGIRDLAYRIAKETKGRYFIIYYDSDGKSIDVFQRHLKLMGDVIRFLTVRTVGGVPEEDIRISELDRGSIVKRARVNRERIRTRESADEDTNKSEELIESSEKSASKETDIIDINEEG
ncbi:MAG: 30S ribosomal protein S6 [bacterium]